MRTIATLEELKSLVGQEVAVSDWITITQHQINLFAEATGDHQWIHVDAERAADLPRRGGPPLEPVARGAAREAQAAIAACESIKRYAAAYKKVALQAGKLA